MGVEPEYSVRTRTTYTDFYVYFLMLLPALILYIVFFLIPVIGSFGYSVTNFNGINMNYKFVGLRNFRMMLEDIMFIKSMVNTFIFTILVIIIQNMLGFVVAILLYEKLRFGSLYTALLFLPSLIPGVVVAYLWTYMYSMGGFFNTVLEAIGLGSMAQPWLGQIDTALYAVILAHVWRFIGRSSLLFTANLASIPTSMQESAMIDGAGWWRRLTHIILPMMAPSFSVNVITSFMGSLKVFDIIYGMTDGGPAGATETLGTFIIKLVRQGYNGYAAAGSVLLVFLILVINRLLVFGFGKWERSI
jgi:ABC-type sugar transport system permease subunit